MADFSGHGVVAALNAFRLQVYLKEHYVQAARPGEYLSLLNDKMLGLLARGQFATMFYGIVDTQSSKLFYACACNPSPLVYRRASGKVDILDGSGPMLGIGMQLYQTQTIPFNHGDVLILYSDVFTETLKKSGKYITEEDLAKIIETHGGASSSTLCDALLSYFHQEVELPIHDDLTLLVCQRVSNKHKKKGE